MATPSALYRNDAPRTNQNQIDLPERPSTIGQVCRDLEELCAQGFLEAFRDEYNIVRYRPVLFGRAKRTA